MKKTRIVLIVVMLVAVPATRYLVEFRLGARCLPYGYSMAYGLFFLLLAPPLLGIATAFLVPMRRIAPRVILGLGTAILTPVLALFAVPAGAVIYSRGFEHAIRSDPGIPALQDWAEGALRDFHLGSGVTTNKPAYWNPGDVMLDRTSLPSFLTSGAFFPLNVPHFGPEISVVTNTNRFGISGECIAISWYLHGLLVGPPDFKTEWNPWYGKELAPGVNSYHGMK
jgi:hypothetical protein